VTTWRLLLVGFGTVGRGVAERLLRAAGDLRAAGCDARVVGVLDPVVGSVADAAGLDLRELLDRVAEGEDPGELGEVPPPGIDGILSVGADVVVEVTPTDLDDGQPGVEHVRAALQAGRHVITTNKGPVALAWGRLSPISRERGVELRCEGTVLSGTPVLSLCETGLAGAGIRSVRGIVNGTCNFILCEMESGRGYDEALARAQERGYAEADPAGDVEGWDAAAKAVILGNLVLGGTIELDDVERTGIAGLGADDLAAARETGERWRLVTSVVPAGDGTAGDERLRATVRPERLPAGDPLAAVTGPGNLLAIETDALGTVTVGGPGAGRAATGHAVIADLLAIHRRHAT